MKIPKIILILISLISVVVIFGWSFEIPVLTSVMIDWVPMRFIAAISFLLISFMIYFITEMVRGINNKAIIVIPIVTTTVFSFMFIILVSIIFNINLGIEYLFINNTSSAEKFFALGKPSVISVIGLILISISGFLSIYSPASLKKYLKIVGLIILGVGSLAIFGYIFSIPVLYYSIGDIISPMPFIVAILFILTGIDFLYISNYKYFNLIKYTNEDKEEPFNEIKKEILIK